MAESLTAFRTVVTVGNSSVRRTRVVLAKSREYALRMVHHRKDDHISCQHAGPFEDLMARMKTGGSPSGRDLRSFYVEIRSSLNANPSLAVAFRSVVTSVRNSRLANALVAGIEIAEKSLGNQMMLDCLRGVLPAAHIERLSGATITGEWKEVISELAKTSDRQVKVTTRILQVVVPPMLTITCAIAAGIFIALTQLPAIASLFASSKDVELPLPSQLLLALVAFIKDWPLLGVAIVATPIIAFIAAPEVYNQNPKIQDFVDRVPVVGILIARIRWSNLLRMLSMLMKAHTLTNHNCLELTARSTKHFRSRDFLRACAHTVERDTVEFYTAARLHEGVLGNTDSRWIDLLPLGSESGATPELLNTVANDYEERADIAMESLPKFAEFVGIAIAGAIVGTIMAATILPTFRLSSALH